MDYSQKLALSYYKTITTLNEAHNVFLVQHQETHKIYVKKILSIYNMEIYKSLSINHINGTPSIIEYYEENDKLTLIESYISGESLTDIIANHQLDLTTILDYAYELCTILKKLHNMYPPIIHRDIKPSNIIIDENNHVVLIDFNAAKFYSSNLPSDTILLGTKGYAAPEQYGFGSSSPKTDIYNLGILLKEMTASLSDIPPYLTKIIEKCTKIDPEHRFNSVTDLENALKTIYSPSDLKISIPALINSFLPPGFRSHSVFKMLLAIPSYLFIFWLSLSVNVENVYGTELQVTRIFLLFMFIAIIFGTFNYLNIQNYFPLCKSRYKLLKYIGIALLDATLVTALFITLLILIGIFFR